MTAVPGTTCAWTWKGLVKSPARNAVAMSRMWLANGGDAARVGRPFAIEDDASAVGQVLDTWAEVY